MPSAWMPLPVLPSDSGLRCVKTCMRVVLNQTKNGLSALAWRSMKSLAAAEELLVDGLHALRVQRTGVLDLAVGRRT